VARRRRKLKTVFRVRELAPPEHYLPLLYVMGASFPGELVTFPAEGIDGGVGLDARRALQGRQTLRAVWLAILSKFLSVLRRVSVCRMQMCAIKASMVPT
jgi:hypothetical protein